MLGGIINVAAGVAYALLLGLGLGPAGVPSAGMSLLAMLRAETGKILLIVGALWLVLSIYREVVPVAFFSARRRSRTNPEIVGYAIFVDVGGDGGTMQRWLENQWLVGEARTDDRRCSIV